MRISQVICSLSELKSRLGDVEVRCDYPCGAMKSDWGMMDVAHGHFDDGVTQEEFALLLGFKQNHERFAGDKRIVEDSFWNKVSSLAECGVDLKTLHP